MKKNLTEIVKKKSCTSMRISWILKLRIKKALTKKNTADGPFKILDA